ncbi:hypothetical protein TNCV_4229471 [Trichonephila clavipes]|nr:hypothetical protein TNCV_4229471 [Trichonephila clavipes]
MAQKKTGQINHCTSRISSPRQYRLQSSSLQNQRTSAYGAAIAGNSSGTKQDLTVRNKKKSHGAQLGE